MSDILPFALASKEILKLKDNRIEVISGLAKIGVHQMSRDVIHGVLRLMVRQKMIQSFGEHTFKDSDKILPTHIITFKRI